MRIKLGQVNVLIENKNYSNILVPMYLRDTPSTFEYKMRANDVIYNKYHNKKVLLIDLTGKKKIYKYNRTIVSHEPNLRIEISVYKIDEYLIGVNSKLAKNKHKIYIHMFKHIKSDNELERVGFLSTFAYKIS